MIGNNKLLAIIPARGSSKRLPRKNILDLNGKPLIAWTIEAGLHSKYIDRLIVSTDDDEISFTAKQWGADVPFIRPAELASDTATTVDTIRHAITQLAEGGEVYEYVLLLQPTSPLRTSFHIDQAVQLLLSKSADCVIGVVELSHPFEWTNTLEDDLSMDGFISEKNYFTRSQDFPKRYRINGAIYLIKTESFFSSGKMIADRNSYAYLMDKKNSIDIDEEFDFVIAENLMNIE